MPGVHKRLQLTPNNSFQSIRTAILAASAVRQRWRSALLVATEPPLRSKSKNGQSV